MTPEIRGRMQAIRAELALPDTPEARKIQLCKESVAMCREARGIIITAVEAKRPAKRKAKASGDDLLDSILKGDDA